MTIQSKFHSNYLFILFFAFSLAAFSSCKTKTEDTPKLDYVSLISGDYKGSIKVGDLTFSPVEASIRAGSTADEMIFTEKIANSDSTTQFKIQLVDLSSQQAIGLFVPQQTIGGVQVVGKILGSSATSTQHGYFLYQDTDTKKIINQFVFSISANGGDYVYTFDKKE